MIDSIYQIADELRGIANLGLRFAQDGHDRERYQKVLKASARMVADLEDRSSDKVLAQYKNNFSHVSPLAGAASVLFKNGNILLIKRHDDGLWAIPGGLVEVGETAAETAQRELYEEVGIQAEIVSFLGVFDSRIWKSKTSMQLFHFVFLVEAENQFPRTSSEAVEVGFFSETNLPPLSSGHHLRVPFYFKQLRAEAPVPYFDRGS
jgi:ADP-ribose pyrophosphatase YjhB (NUDIX family)